MQTRPGRCGRQLQLGDDHPGDATDERNREVDLPDQEDEHDPVGQHAHARQLADQVGEVDRGEPVARGQAEVEDDEEKRDDDRRVAEVPRADIELEALPVALLLGLDREGGRLGAHAPLPVPAMPATLVGVPAVIAWTISSWLVFARS